jgi:hypothetical protein
VLGRVTWGGGVGGGGGGLVPWNPRPKLIPERDGMYGASGDAHLRMEVSGACRGPSFVLEALWRNGRVYALMLQADVQHTVPQRVRGIRGEVRGPGYQAADGGSDAGVSECAGPQGGSGRRLWDEGTPEHNLHAVVIRLSVDLLASVAIHIGETRPLFVKQARSDYTGGAGERTRWGHPGVEAPTATWLGYSLLDSAVCVCAPLRVQGAIYIYGAAHDLV